MSEDQFPTARAAGFHMPAEWERHSQCWMAWPARLDLWGKHLDGAQEGYANVANAISEFEPVMMLASPRGAGLARNMCGDGVTVIPVEIDDSWTRDSGPNFVVNGDGKLAASVFQFNAWGQKYAPYGRDAAVGHRIAEYLGVPTFTSGLFLEGGAISVDGQGTVLTTKQCVLNPNRNPGLSRASAEKALCEALGVSNVVWLPGDPDDFETDGHVDGIACFIEPGTVLVELCPALGTRRSDNLQKNLEVLKNAADAQGDSFEIEIVYEAYEAERRSEIFASSYINFYIANNAVVMPSFGIDRDEQARGIFASLFPDREVVQVDVSSIGVGGGGIHCITQQQPQAKNGYLRA